MSEPPRRFSLRLPPDLRAELELEVRAQHRRSLSNLIVYALREWLAGRGRPRRLP